MPTFTLRGRITADRRLEVQLPPDAPEGEAQVTVAIEDQQTPPRGSKEQILAYLDELHRKGLHTYRTRDEIDRYLREERNSWGDE